jgi:hypothetical protein
MEDADIARDELDQHFVDAVAAATAALSEAEARLGEWRGSGTVAPDDAIAAWKRTARKAYAAAHEGRDPQPEIDRTQAMRRWVEAHGFWSDDDLPADVEVALRKASRSVRAAGAA